MPARKLNDEQVKELVEDVIKGEFYKADIIKKYDIGDSTFPIVLKRAIKEGFMTEEQRLEWIRKTRKRIWDAKVKKYGIKGASELCKKAWENGLGQKSLEEWRDWSRLGGNTTQALYPHVKENLKNSDIYRANRCCYEDIKFDSFGERFIGLLLLNYKLIYKVIDKVIPGENKLIYEIIYKLIPGENFQKKFGRKRVDFFIEEKNLVVEYHPILKNHSKIEYLSEEEFKRKREKELKESGFFGEVLVITSVSDFYRKLPKLGIEGVGRKTHGNIVRKVKDLLNDYDSIHDLEERVEEEIDEEDDEYNPFF